MEEEKKKKSFWKKLKKYINKNKKRQGIAYIIGSVIGAYLSVIMIFVTLKSHGLAAGLLAVTTLMFIVATIAALITGWSKLDDYNSGW